MAAIVANCAISLNCELTQPVKVQYIDGNMFSMDNAGNTAHVYVFYNGEPQEIVGSVSADVIRSDGTTVAITGAMSGNRAYVIFPQSCYAVPGVVSVVIKVTEGSTVTTIAAFVANVYRSSTDTIVDPGTIIPSVQNLISAIETAVASIPADYSSLWESLAPDYANITFPVTAGKYCTYNGTLYIAKVDIATTESFTAAHWQSTNIGDNLSALKSAIEAIESIGASSVSFGWLQSTDIYSNSGTDRDNRPTRSRSDYILLPKGAKLTVTPSPWYIQWYRYNATTKAWIDASSFTASWTNKPFSLKYDDADYYFRFVVRDANSNANVTASSITVKGEMQYPIVAQVIENTNDIANLKDKAQLITPTSLRICGGIEQNFYFQNILRNFDARQAYEIKTTTFATNFNEFARLSPSASSETSHGFRFYLYKFDSTAFVESAPLNYQVVPASSGSGLTKKVLIIGDSLTFNAPLTKHLVDDLLADDVMTVDLIGTLGSAPYLREGRPGWSAYTYTHEASHTNESGSTFTNAFWNPSTEKFDFSYYMTQNSFSGVDYVFINLGTNDFGRDVADIVDDLNEMVTSIHAYSASIRIGVWTPPPRGLTGNGSLVNRDVLLGIVGAILTEFEGKESSKVYTVPVTLNVDPYHDFPMESVNVSAENTDYQMLITTDKVHPSNAGYAKMADMIYSYIKYFGSLDAT